MSAVRSGRRSGASRGTSPEMREVIAWAEARGWSAARTAGGHVRFMRDGCRPVFAAATPSDGRAAANTRALLRRETRSAAR